MKQKSRPQQWAEAVESLESTVEAAKTALEQCDTPLEDLQSLQSEYQEWLDNLPEGGSEEMRSKLEEVTGLDFEVCGDLESIESACKEAGGVDLPLGFGRD